MPRSLIERRLFDVAERMRALREELAIADEQLAALAEDADDARIRALVSETPIAGREHAEAQRHADAMARHRAEVAHQLEELDRTQDDLLDRLLSHS